MKKQFEFRVEPIENGFLVHARLLTGDFRQGSQVSGSLPYYVETPEDAGEHMAQLVAMTPAEQAAWEAI